MRLENQPYGGDIDQKIDGGCAWESRGDAGDFIEPAVADSGSGVYRSNPVVYADFSKNDANYAKFGDFHDANARVYGDAGRSNKKGGPFSDVGDEDNQIPATQNHHGALCIQTRSASGGYFGAGNEAQDSDFLQNQAEDQNGDCAWSSKFSGAHSVPAGGAYKVSNESEDTYSPNFHENAGYFWRSIWSSKQRFFAKSSA